MFVQPICKLGLLGLHQKHRSELCLRTNQGSRKNKVQVTFCTCDILCVRGNGLQICIQACLETLALFSLSASKQPFQLSLSQLHLIIIPAGLEVAVACIVCVGCSVKSRCSWWYFFLLQCRSTPKVCRQLKFYFRTGVIMSVKTCR